MDHATLLRLLNAFHQAHVLVLGDVMLDRFVYGTVERISPEAPIPVLSVERTVDMPGGAANVARNVATLGAQVSLVGVAGDDPWASDLITEIEKVATIAAHIVRDPSRPTTLKTRHVADGQQILRSDVEKRAALDGQVARELLAVYQSKLESADVVILSDYAKGVLSEATVDAAIAMARSAGRPVLVDPKSKSFLKYRGATLLTPNRNELQLACGHECSTDDQVIAGAQEILRQGICSSVVVTRGKDGMTVVKQDGTAVHLSTVAREIYDVSGAGDTAVATLSLALAAGADIESAARLANIAAGIVVGKYGTAAVTAGEIVATLEQGHRSSTVAKNFTLESAVQLVNGWRERGFKIAFANGCFDLLHPGHLALLEQAKSSADRLIVGLNSDLSVRQLKGPARPIQGEVARATVLASLKSVDAVVIFGEQTPLKLIEALQPDVLVKGADYTLDKVVGADIVLRRGGRVLLADLVPSQSTTSTLKKISETGRT
jgi:D-beta-D-heptose 7-phosphate kinase / D-beta-D-heptose 1-phosphate adenosyltransferase